MTEYKQEFIDLVDQCSSNEFIGSGNPNANILIVGKEVATNPYSDKPLEKQNMVSYLNNVSDWKENIKGIQQENVKNWVYDENRKPEEVDNNPLFAFKGSIVKDTSDTWDKYQKLYDIVFNNGIDNNREKELDFQKEFFITEMSNIPSPKTHNAQREIDFKANLERRKNNFFRSKFILDFPIVVLACSNYIRNKKNDWQIYDIFKVTFDAEKKFSNGEYVFSPSNKFYAHYSDDGKRLVIHTRQLSMNVKDDMLKEMGALIREHLKKIGYIPRHPLA